MPELSVFTAPYDWAAIDAEVAIEGAAVVRQFVAADLLASLNAQCEHYCENSVGATGGLPGLPNTGSQTYNVFLGHKTVRLHGLLEKFPACARLLGDSALLAWATRSLNPVATSVRLSAAELIQIQPGEPRQAAHRDSDSWPLPVGEHPHVVNAIVALSEFTADNGGTWVAPHSWQWSADHEQSSTDFVQATMGSGDALLFRGDLVHGAGANASENFRRAISVSFCAGWLRGVENSALNLSKETVRGLSPQLKAVLGFAAYDGSSRGNGLLGLYENGDPSAYLK